LIETPRVAWSTRKRILAAVSDGPPPQRNRKRGMGPRCVARPRNTGRRSRSIGPFLSIFFRLLHRTGGPASAQGSATGARPMEGGNRQTKPWAEKQQDLLEREWLNWAERPTTATRRNRNCVREPLQRIPNNPFQPRGQPTSAGRKSLKISAQILHPPQQEPKTGNTHTLVRLQAIATRFPNHCDCRPGHKLTKRLRFAIPIETTNYEKIVKAARH